MFASVCKRVSARVVDVVGYLQEYLEAAIVSYPRHCSAEGLKMEN